MNIHFTHPLYRLIVLYSFLIELSIVFKNIVKYIGFEIICLGREKMKFYTANGLERPVRLSESTRLFAYESLGHKYGLDTKKTDWVTLDGIDNFDKLTELEKYDAAIAKIASDAPIRICDGEKISGAATLGMGICHAVPASRNGDILWSSISHLTVDFETVLKHGMVYIRKQAEQSLEKFKGQKQEAFIKSCLNCIDSFETWRGRYLEALKNRP